MIDNPGSQLDYGLQEMANVNYSIEELKGRKKSEELEC